MLTIGQKVRTELLGETLIVKKKLGEGGQGAVYLVEGPTYKQKALKWYNTEQATEEQKKMIGELIHHGIPSGDAGRRFVWPLDLVTIENNSQFGYLMDLIDTSRFAELGEVWARKKPTPTMQAMCQISYEMADSYRKLHLQGLCYRDISSGNIMFDPRLGDVLICDNDNIGINNQSDTQVWGTMEYMAPELIVRNAKPSTDTDLHSLAVLLFQLWVWHHPMHGLMEYNIRSWDLPAKKKIYGEQPVFIFDPQNKTNELPNDPDYETAKKRWACCPKPLQDKFIQAFTAGLRDPKQRVTEGEWRRLFLELKDCMLSCPHDGAENFWSEEVQTVNCWHCKRSIPIPPKLLLTGPSGKQYFLLTKTAILRKSHIQPNVSDAQANEPAGQLVQNPNNPSVWGLRNLTDQPWKAVLDGTEREIAPQKAAPLSLGLTLDFGLTKGIIQN